ncbi:MAG: BrnT family toxin [Bryobacteraceae bacterium]
MDFEVATLVFDDPNHRSGQDRFVNGEERWQTIGLANELLLVCHTWTDEEVIRIVSARKAKKESLLSWPSSAMNESPATRSRAGRRET